MAIRERLSGNEAVATAMKQINPDTVAAYPITPSTEVPQYFSNFVANGEVTTEFTATSSQGLAYMFEMLYIAAGMRLPITLVCGNRALSAPLNIHNDHSDSMGVRDAGFIQLYCESNQEAYDNVIMAVKIAEKANIPVMVCYDGFITSHSVENIMLIEDEEVKKFVSERKPTQYLLDDERNISMGPMDLQKYYFEHRKQLADAMVGAKEIIKEVSEEFYELTGRKYDLYEKYMMDDAEVGVIVLNSTAGTAKDAVDELRAQGVKAGLIKPRTFRPLPADELPEELRNLKALAIMDKADSVNGYAAPLFTEITSAMYTKGLTVPTVDYVYGLGGVDVKVADIKEVYTKLQEIAQSGKVDKTTHYLGMDN